MDEINDSGHGPTKVLAFCELWYNALTSPAVAGQKLLLGALQAASLFACEVIIPYPQSPQEFVGGFTRRSSALAEPDNDKINAMSNHLVLASRIYAAEGFLWKPSLIVFIIP